MVELIDETATSEIELRRGPSEATRRVGTAVAAVLVVGFAVASLRTSHAVVPVEEDPESPIPLVWPAEPGLPTDTTEDTSSSSVDQRIIRLPPPLAVPESVDISPASQRPLTLVGQNERGQIVAVDLFDGAVRELDPTTGQHFIARRASDRSVAGFRAYLNETILVRADGVVRTMPVIEMELPVVFPAADGDGYVVHTLATNRLITVDENGQQIDEPLELAAGLTVEAVVADGLIVRSLDEIDRRFDPETRRFGDALTGRVIDIGRTRYVSLTCDEGVCRVEARSLTDDGRLAELGIDSERVPERLRISPSDTYLAEVGGGVVTIHDLSTGAVVAELTAVGNGDFVWGPDDTLALWSDHEDGSSRLVHFFTPGDDPGLPLDAVELPSSILDIRNAVHLLRPSS